MADTSSNPLQIQVTDVRITKFNKTDSMSIFPQFVELVLYQSLFEPVIKAEMLVSDKIGLFTNYPFTGEEFIDITYKTLTGINATTSTEKKIKFIIRGVRNIIADDNARALLYVIDLTSVEFLQNTRKYVSHAYADLVEDMAEKVYDDYIKKDTQELIGETKPFVKEESIKVRSLIVPNVRPFQAIQWLAKHAVAKDYDKKFQYLFFENLDGFNFVTLQKLIEDGKQKRGELQSKAYVYRSDVEAVQGTSDPEAPLRLITNLVINKRFSSIEKISSGYYQNELFEISMLQKAYHVTPTELKPEFNIEKLTLEGAPLNTKGYIEYVKNKVENTEYANRVRYIINNYEDFDGQAKTQPEYRLKVGQAMQNLIALNQIDLTITVPANMDLKAGQIIYVKIPEMHGFNDVQLDLYITGLYIINEVKQVVSIGNQAATTLRIYKDGYFTSLYENSFYNKNGGLARSSEIIDPDTGKPTTRAGGPR